MTHKEARELAKIHKYLNQHLYEYVTTVCYIGSEFSKSFDGTNTIYACKCGARFAYVDSVGWHEFDENTRDEFISIVEFSLPQPYRKLFKAFINKKKLVSAWSFKIKEGKHKSYPEKKVQFV